MSFANNNQLVLLQIVLWSKSIKIFLYFNYIIGYVNKLLIKLRIDALAFILVTPLLFTVSSLFEPIFYFTFKTVCGRIIIYRALHFIR